MYFDCRCECTRNTVFGMYVVFVQGMFNLWRHQGGERNSSGVTRKCGQRLQRQVHTCVKTFVLQVTRVVVVGLTPKLFFIFQNLPRTRVGGMNSDVVGNYFATLGTLIKEVSAKMK